MCMTVNSFPKSRRTKHTFAATIAWIAVTSSACAQPAPPQSGSSVPPATRQAARTPIDAAELGRFVDPLISAQMEKERIPGAVFVLVQNGSVLYQRGYGLANLGTMTKVDPEKTIWRIGSISKVFTATAVAQLADRGRFKLTDDVNQYLTDFKVPATFPEPVRFHHLLTHTAGFDEIRPGTRAESPAGLLPVCDFVSTRLVRLRPPGRTISYSTYGVTLADCLIEKVSGTSFEDYLAKNVWGPLGMTRTNIVLPDSLRNDMAQGYEYDNGSNKVADWEWYHTTPASSINASGADMARFIIAHLQNGAYRGTRILSEAAARDMHRQHATSHPKLAGFAYGFYEDFTNGERMLEHGGNVEGFSAQMTLLPERGVGFFIATQHEPAQLRDVIRNALLDHYFPATTKRPPAVPMPGYRERAPRFAGTYELNQFCHTCGANRRVYTRIEVKAHPDGSISITGNKEHFVEVSPLFFQRVSGSGGAAFREDTSGRVSLLAGDSWLVFERIDQPSPKQ
ncbi:MAG TPA: serine hydrolase domain-containing protein [Gemmatimonadaceae bacterium]|nr:serine hydrolase domain-containing protein [Gemmatimonadaceae bacterium]